MTDTDYRAMSLEELGLYHRCLDLAWINNGLPADPKRLAAAVGIHPLQLKKLWGNVGLKFVPSTAGTLVNMRQEKERVEALKRSEHGEKGAFGKHKKGLLGQCSGSAQGLLRAYDSLSMSSSISSKKQKPDVAITPADPFAEDPEITAMWIRAGFDSPQGFEGWYKILYAEHPTRGEYGIARDFLAMEVIAGTLTRTEFEEGYAAHRLSGAWKRDGGRYIPKLSVFCRDHGWKFPPAMAKATIGNSEDNY